ncbi:MAG: glycerophosphodiester phosphodiesterase [Gemmatimonadaceae bacterium]|nr:glycerophosphodiester phosphodiesterase [Gemmatimonadaceae bacterium]
MRLTLSIMAATMLSSCATFGPRREPPVELSPLVIAHRGASGHRPEHTLAAYALAIDMGADYIEPDLVITRDSVLVARHENEIGGTTDVAMRYPARRTAKMIDGARIEGWFTEDFTLAELKTLRTKERIAPRSKAHDGEDQIPTFEEILDLVAQRSRAAGRRIGIYPETKHSSYFRALGRPLEEPLLAALARRGLTTKASPIFIQSFEVANLRALRERTGVRLVQLIGATGAPPDTALFSDVPRDVASMITPAGLAAIARYADAIGVEKSLVQPIAPDGTLGIPTSLVADAHRAGLKIHVWTLRSDPAFLPAAYFGDAGAEWRRFSALGVDGMFGDFPDVGMSVRAR